MHTTLKTIIVPIVSVLILIIIIMWMAGTFESKIKPGTLSLATRFNGDTLTVETSKIAFHEDVPATVTSKQSINIASRILAPIKSIRVKSGDRVDKGDLLIELDNRNSRAAVAQTREHIRSIQAKIVQAKSHYHRTKDLYNKQSATKANFEQASANYNSLKAQLSAARQQLESAETTQSYSKILAPFSARVVDRLAEPGDLATPGQALLTLYDPDTLRINAHVRESLALSLKLGQQLTADIQAIQQNIKVTVEEIVPAADPGSRSFLIKTNTEPNSQLLPGMFARVRIPSKQQKRILIPESFIKQVGQLDIVWVMENKHPVRRFIRLGQLYDNKIEVVSGLSDGEVLANPDDIDM